MEHGTQAAFVARHQRCCMPLHAAPHLADPQSIHTCPASLFRSWWSQVAC